jgi:hypothetical protein
VATRKLIIAALCCGLAILLAGGVWLVASGKDDDKTSPLLEAGQPAKVGGLGVTALGGALDGQDLVLTVEGGVPEGGSTLDDFGSGWSVVSPTGAKLARAADREVDLDVAPCSTEHIEPGATARCFILFALDSPQTSVAGFTTVYSRDDDIAAWLLQ